ncbi:type VII secretion protein EccB [Mycolicibacterium sphagni]|uniref:Type VII secretion protein EccB n=1 Tax=Mycolicibacterium sphagni TaxID=1786 RepID=A0ABX2K0S8_9MYCO|nr:type VII secretion protein EccB [Mycolicibacterium sphagni]NTY60691.1 type VII secretion protein EccB [Mycolicibacterium sphagni]
MGFRLTTKVQVSGWRFLLRRLEHAIVRRDTRMFDDPLQFYGRSAAAGVVIALLIAVGAGALALFKPQGKLGGGDLFADGTTYQVYLQLSGKLHPVFNLTSARLVLGSPADPSVVKSAELEKLPRGQWIGIPGAPYSTPVSGSSSSWALCDTVVNPSRTAPTVKLAIISMPLFLDSAVDPLEANEALLAFYQDQEFLITPQGRHAIDRSNRALAAAVGMPADTTPIPVTEGVFNALPDAGAWQLPPIPGFGQPNTLGLPDELVIGSVFTVNTPSGPEYHLVLPNGTAKVNSPTAAALRATESFGLVDPPAVVPSIAVNLPDAVYKSPLPDTTMKIVSRTVDPVLCWTWERGTGDKPARTRVITGPRLPISPSADDAGINQIQGTSTVYTDGGKYVALQSPDPRVGEALYYIDQQGVRYGLPDQKTAGALGLSSPTTAPWEVVRLLVDGPVLSQEAALLEHDTVSTEPTPRKVAGGPS